MRAKRSKKYRKLMHQYELTFGFREPYQVLAVDSNFLHAVHHFKMDLIPALERTLQGKVKPCMCKSLVSMKVGLIAAVLSKCSLAAIMASQPTIPGKNNPIRPAHLPPPTTLPLRHCSHNDDDSPIDEVDCLISLICPNSETMRNREHYTLATADPPALPEANATNPRTRKRAQAAKEGLNQRASALRAKARSIPGVPIIYVKRSVMILEPISAHSEKVRLGVEKSKFKTGLESTASVVGKRKRDEDEPKGERGVKRAKAPNPLSVKRPKKREGSKVTEALEAGKDGENKNEEITGHSKDTSESGTKRKRRHRGPKMVGSHGTEGTEPAATSSAPVGEEVG
ncbi:hypothetical protein Egran_06712 [Elaphomyces granulatus]|uniref:UTP23 sensor motif region domain-containing protein n=1 Tax=Elaphomyces granulatus TaxID=519963 RepID=A0A232LMY3_9EURO|nr:hypothetical protein Egran_06712 [Elaphomyces granulatus]